MKKIKLQNSNKVALVDDEDFEWLNSYTWYLDSDGYPICFETRKRMHKMILEGREVDHKNGDPVDAQRSNLRSVTHKQNTQNSKAHKDGSSRYKGVSKRRNGWRAQICKDGKKMLIGTFLKERWAAYAYDIAARDLHGPYGRSNFPLACSSARS